MDFFLLWPRNYKLHYIVLFFCFQIRCAEKGQPLSLYRIIFNSFGSYLLLGGILKLFVDTTSFLTPIILSAALTYVTEMKYGDAGDIEVNVLFIKVEKYTGVDALIIAILYRSM